MKRYKKILIVVTVIAVIVPTLLVLQNRIQSTNPKIMCDAYENDTSGWYYYGGSPTFGSYVDTVNFGVRVQNFGDKTLFNVRVEVTYKTTSNNWNTVTSENLGVLDIGEWKQTWVTLKNPILSEWHITNAVISYDPLVYGNITRYVLNETDYKITAYGYAKP